MVQPSGFDLATKSVPIVVLAPERFSTTTDCLSSVLAPSATVRAMRSPTPPGGLATIILMYRAEQASAAIPTPMPAKPVMPSRTSAPINLPYLAMFLSEPGKDDAQQL